MSGEKGHHEKSISIDISQASVREEINMQLMCIANSLTPYIGIERARKVLAPYSVFIPASNYMEGDSGVRTFNVTQFNAITGMTNDGKVMTKTESPYHVFFDYSACGGMFICRCKLLTDEELDDYMSNYERALHEEKDDDKKKPKKENALVARVKHAHISDAWMFARRKKDKNFLETIKAKLKIKGIPVSDDEIRDSISKFNKEKPMRPYKKKDEENLSEAIANYIERLEELTAPTWDNVGKVLKRSGKIQDKHETKSFKLDRQADRANHMSGIAKKLGFTGIATKLKKRENRKEEEANKEHDKGLVALANQANATGRRLRAMRHPNPQQMKEENLSEGLISQTVKKLTAQTRLKKTHTKINKQMDDRQVEVLGRKATLDDHKELGKDKRYHDLNTRHMATHEPKIPTKYMTKRKK